MRALTFDGTSPGLVTSRTAPRPGEGETLVRTLRAGVSSTDLAICRGLMGFTGVLGHEFVGIAESVSGPDHLDVKGRRVVGAIGGFCGRCDMCQSGLREHCRERTLLGIQGRDGCLADSLTLPVSNLVPVPDDVDDDQAVFAGTLAAAIQAARQLTIEGKPYITVLGDGPLGLLMAQVMAKLNASVRLVGHHTEKLARCERWGIKHRHVNDVGRRADQDIVVDCTGSGTGLEIAMQLVRPRGTIVVKSMYARHPERSAHVDFCPVVMKEITVLGSRSGPIREALSTIADGSIDVVSLIGKRMTLNDGPAVLNAAAQPGMLKVLVDV